MTYVLDAHAIVWFLETNPRLPSRVDAILRDPASTLVVPTIVLAEIWHLSNRGRIATSLADVRGRMLGLPNCSVHPLDESILDLLPAGFELYDAVIVATGLLYRDVLGDEVRVVTRDQVIVQSGLVEIFWS